MWVCPAGVCFLLLNVMVTAIVCLEVGLILVMQLHVKKSICAKRGLVFRAALAAR